MKVNYVGVVAGAIAVASLFLPWWTITLKMSGTDAARKITADFGLYLYQLTGTINGVSHTVGVGFWFCLGAIALIAAAGLALLAGSFLAGKNGKLLLIAGGVLALLSMAVFGFGLMDYSEKITIGYAVDLFPAGSFGYTSQTLMDYDYNAAWFMGVGFWLALAAAVIAFVSIATHPSDMLPSENAAQN